MNRLFHVDINANSVLPKICSFLHYLYLKMLVTKCVMSVVLVEPWSTVIVT